MKNSQGFYRLHFEIDYDPELHQLAVHEVGLWRDNSFFSFADQMKFRLRQREASLESQILHGRVSAILVLDDLRVGDALEEEARSRVQQLRSILHATP